MAVAVGRAALPVRGAAAADISAGLLRSAAFPIEVETRALAAAAAADKQAAVLAALAAALLRAAAFGR